MHRTLHPCSPNSIQLTQQFRTLLLLALLVFCSEWSHAQISFSGYGATGYRIYDREILRRYNFQVYYEGKFQANITVNKQIEAQLDFRGNSEDNEVNFREFSAKFEYFKTLKFKVGNIRIPFGLEQMIERDEYYTIDHSFIHRTINNFGYGDRAVSIMAYYNYSEKREDYPYSYHFSIYKNNSQVSGAAARFSFHGESWTYSAGYLIQHQGGEEDINAQGLSADVSYQGTSFSTSIEAFYVQDPVEGIRRELTGLSDRVAAGGVKSISATQIAIGGEIVKTIEPVVGFGYYTPDWTTPKAHTLQTVLAGNFYLDKDVRLRLNIDLLFTRNQFSNKYSTNDSRYTLELQVRY